jgi:uncharacterized protein (TIGR02246 family)
VRIGRNGACAFLAIWGNDRREILLRRNESSTHVVGGNAMTRLIWTAAFVALFCVSPVVLGQEKTVSSSKPATNSSSDESALRANVQAFAKAYNAGDAKAIARLFAPEAQMIDEDGTTTQGRDAIEKTFADIFADSPKGRIDVHIDSIQFMGSALALEKGRAKVISAPGEAADATDYTVLHSKSRDGKWQMAYVRDDPEPEDQLKELAWMIGDWIDESPDSIVMTSCKWADNKNFILQDIKVRMRGADTTHLTQRIGWDPLTKQIKAWLFDSEGGYGESYWTRDGERWVAKATAVRRDGTTASMTNVFTPTGKDSYTWRSTDRIVGGEVLPPQEVKVTRKPPEAGLGK